MVDFAVSRTRMVDNQLRTNDITELRLLDAMGEVPRERFVAKGKEALAYIDECVAENAEATRFLLKPHILGRMVQAASIQPSDVVLVVGAGAGYAVAVAAKLAESVVGVECDAQLVQAASDTLVDLGIDNAAVIEGTLSEGYAQEAPYDVVLVNGSVDEAPKGLLAQLKAGGRLVCVEGQGNAGVAQIYVLSEGVVSERFGFNATAPRLPGFEKEAGFQF
ncbi:protein-L-isoaspartate O-methyltransferase family protein [Polycladidibacter hongkongensis]|uniref:protein-L-isoaspartate O-methyltransferase family protein n=1 Tax=Polycladidibacter hongkongensis TaxID=1647556 RepID=UPI00082A3302|nr:protein-L-isoaspartate O-methyltransferase [Pseudovibrio hongkongensis]